MIQICNAVHARQPQNKKMVVCRMLPGVAWEVSKMHVWEERLVRNCENGLNPDAKLLKDKKFGAKLCEQAVGIWQG